ncbi:MAG: GntR family transcriptional regulator [bacterium]
MTLISDSPVEPVVGNGQIVMDRLPLHAKVRETIRDMVIAEFKDGQKFLSEAVLVQRLGVSLGTVRHALSDLTREGLLVRLVPQGTFVRKPDDQGWDIRVIMPQTESIFLATLMEKVVMASQEMDLNLRIHQTHRGETTADILRLVHGVPTRQRVILLGEMLKTARGLYMALAKRGYRVVNVDNLLVGCGDVYVGVDNAIGIRLGMKHLMDLGHRRIALLVNEPATRGNSRDRVQSFKTIVAESGLKQARVVVCDGDPLEESIQGALDRILELKQRPTALFAISDTGAWILLKALAKRGIKVPDEISVIGFDDDQASRYMNPALSTLAQPFESIARRSLELAIQKTSPDGMVLLPPSLVVRESTGPVAP